VKYKVGLGKTQNIKAPNGGGSTSQGAKTLRGTDLRTGK
jgi:hypothetical protein